jgi:hypothetical protein
VSLGGTAIDHRFFYISQQDEGMAVCGVARDLLSVFVREHNDKKQSCMSEPWVNSCRNAVNVVVKGFIAEQIVISAVSARGITLLNDQSYTTTADIIFTRPHQSVTKAVAGVHYIPKPYNYKYVDSVIRVIDSASKGITIIALQPTLQSIAQHKHSLKFFSSGAYKQWQTDLTGFSITWLFVWIVRDAEQKAQIKNYPKISKAADTVSAFTEHCLSFQQVAEALDFL